MGEREEGNRERLEGKGEEMREGVEDYERD